MELQTYLKTSTQVWHRASEEQMFSQEIMSGTLTVEQYIELIRRMAVFHYQAEDVVIELVRNLGFSVEGKSAALAKDIELLGLALPTVKRIQITSKWQALGWVYVMEGATLGGQIILRKLQAIDEIYNTGAIHYYGVYGEKVGAYWTNFRNKLNSLEITVEQRSKILKGAIDAYKGLLYIASEGAVSGTAVNY